MTSVLHGLNFDRFNNVLRWFDPTLPQSAEGWATRMYPDLLGPEPWALAFLGPGP